MIQLNDNRTPLFLQCNQKKEKYRYKYLKHWKEFFNSPTDSPTDGDGWILRIFVFHKGTMELKTLILNTLKWQEIEKNKFFEFRIFLIPSSSKLHHIHSKWNINTSYIKLIKISVKNIFIHIMLHCVSKTWTFLQAKSGWLAVLDPWNLNDSPKVKFLFPFIWFEFLGLDFGPGLGLGLVNT